MTSERARRPDARATLAATGDVTGAVSGGASGVVRGRYILFEAFAKGGMANVHFARMNGPGGLSRVVAIKRMHDGIAQSDERMAMLRDEAQLSGLLHHANTVPIIDVVTDGGEVLLVMDYVDGESVAALATAAARRREPIPCAILSAILADALRGLHAAHTAGEAQGKPRQIVHRDVSPENILVGVDGIARVLDFGVAHATNRAQSTRTGQIKGKLRYLSPEQVHGDATPRSDVFAAGIVAWELLVGERLFGGDSHGATLAEILSAKIARPSRRRPDIPPALDDAVMKSLARNPADRFASALEMAQAVVAAVRPATPIEVAEWVTTLGGAALAARQERARQIERVAAPAPARRRPANPSAAEPSVTAPARPSAAAAWTRRVVVPLALAAVVALSVAMMRATAPDATRPSIDPPAEAGAAPTVADPPAATTERAKTGDPVAPRHEHLVSPARHTASPAADRCKPPYAFDDAGHKHYFPECL